MLGNWVIGNCAITNHPITNEQIVDQANNPFACSNAATS